MLDLYNELGIIPHLQVHDELDLSYKGDIKPVKEIMENCIELEVPLKVSVEKGRSWGEAR